MMSNGNKAWNELTAEVYELLNTIPVASRLAMFEVGLKARYLSTSLACRPSTLSAMTCLYEAEVVGAATTATVRPLRRRLVDNIVAFDCCYCRGCEAGVRHGFVALSKWLSALYLLWKVVRGLGVDQRQSIPDPGHWIDVSVSRKTRQSAREVQRIFIGLALLSGKKAFAKLQQASPPHAVPNHRL
jgi:hypothetical protein